MSSGTPFNPLDAFQSYSVQYILLACRTTVTAKKFAAEDPDTLRTSLQAIDDAKYLGSPVTFDGRSDQIYLVIDTRRFGQFTVQNLKYDVYINGLQKGASQSNLAADLSMTILDSVGVSFGNFMQWLLDSQMKANYDGVVFMLRTIFVGHNADGTSSIVQSETIPMHLQQMEINLDHAKGLYNLEFMPNMNFDVSQHSRFLTMSTSTKAYSADNTLLSLITSLEQELNRASSEYFDKVQGIANSGKQEFVTQTRTLGRKVQYMITIPKHWHSMKLSGQSHGNVVETVFKAQREQAAAEASKIQNQANLTAEQNQQIRDSYFSNNTGALIPNVLEAIFKTVPDIATMGNFTQSTAVQGGMITFFKQIVGLTSDDSTVVVHVDVVEFKVPNLFSNVNPNSTDISSVENEFYVEVQDELGRRIRKPKDYLEWKYIFSGLNDSILNFDVKIQDFQFLLASNLRIGDGALRDSAEASGETPDDLIVKNDALTFAREFDPLVLPLDTKSALDNFSRYSSIAASRATSQKRIDEALQYSKNLSMFYAGSPITVAMTIKGNPLIMHKFNAGQLLPHTGSNTSPSSNPTNSTTASDGGNVDREAYREALENDILKSNASATREGNSIVVRSTLSEKSYAIAPVFARVDILGPSVDFKTNAPLDDGTFSSSVLSNNYYVIFKVSNIFAENLFTQELELYSHNIYGGTKIQNTKSS